MYRENAEICEIQRVQTAGNKTETSFDCDVENLERNKIPVSRWLCKLKAEEGIMRSSGWVLKMENVSDEK